MLDFIKNLLIAGFTLFAVNQQQVGTTLVINELMASNNSTIQDPQLQYDDWIEIYNFGNTAIDVGGMYLTDDLSETTKWRFPMNNPTATVIPAYGYLLVWVDNDTDDAGMHTSFQLSAGGEEIGLFDSDGSSLIDSITFAEQASDISYGRYPDATDTWQFMAAPTPGRENNGGYIDVVADPEFSHKRGFYDAPFSVTITTETEGAIIYYTLDGSEPYNPDFGNPTGRVYSGPISISTTTCLRAAAMKSGWKPSHVDTHTYIFTDDVIKQTQQQALDAGYPDSWSGYPADYEMDPQVYNDPDYAGLMREAMLSIPTISIVTDEEYLFSPFIGIYTNPLAEGVDLEWERPTSAELFCPDGSKEFQVNCGLRIQGGHSRHPHKCPKHSFSLRFRGIYGPTSLDYDLFDDWPVDSFDTLHLRGFFNNAWTHWARDQRERTQYVREPWMRDSLTEMGHKDALQGFYVHLYLNGMYWGLYNLHERPDADHYAAYNGGDAESIDAINGDPTYVISDPLNSGSVSDGTIDAWLKLKQVVKTRNWEQICQLIDIDNFIDWTILFYFAGTTDIKYGTNWRAAGGGPLRRPWRFYSWDAEHVIENVNQRGIATVSDPSGLYDYLVDIEEFRIRFADRLHKHLFNEGALTTEQNILRWTKRADEIDLAVIAESARWGDYRRDVHSYSSGPYYLYTKNEFWIPEKNNVLNDYFPRRTAIALNYFRSQGLYPNVDAPNFNINGVYQHGGHISSSASLTLTVPAGIIYYTLDDSDPRRPGSSGTTVNSSTLVPENAAKRVLVPTGPISDNWKGGQTFDDSSWISGTGGVGYERGFGYEAYFNIDVQQQMYNSNGTCYIRVPFTLSNTQLAAIDSLILNIRYDDGFIAYINGTEVQRALFNGTPTWNSQASSTHNDALAVNFENFDISNYIGSLRQGSNILAIQGLNTPATSSDFLISVELVSGQSTTPTNSTVIMPTAIEYTEPVTLTKSTHVKSRVLDGSTWSALNEATFAVGPVAENLRITEIMYHPETDPNEEFIELKNIGTETINLNLVRFTNGINFTFLDSSATGIDLAPGGYTVVVKDTTTFTARYGTDVSIAGQYSGSLSNAGERIRLEDAVGQMILDFEYKDGWHDTTDGGGSSLTIIDATNTDSNSWSAKDSWRASLPSPGR